MVIDPLIVWKVELQKIPPAADQATAALNLASWYTQRIVGISPNPTALIASGFVFTFPTPIFQAELLKLAPVPDALAGAAQFANAWETAILASVAIVAPGSAVPPPSPPTTFSVVASTVIDPPSIALGKAKILELASAPPSLTALDSKFADIFFQATNLLTITVTGVNSVAPTPAPLVAPLVPLI